MKDPLLHDLPGELITERLRLRTPQAGDGPMVLQSVRMSLPELKPWMSWATDEYGLEDAELWCRRVAARTASRTEVGYLILAADGQHVGNIGLFSFDWAIPKAEIGYWLTTPQCGQGFMSEAVRAIVKLAREQLSMVRIEIRTDVRNSRSRGVAERNGFQLEGTLRKSVRDLRDVGVYALIDEDNALRSLNAAQASSLSPGS